jgi:hypothetical protein
VIKLVISVAQVLCTSDTVRAGLIYLGSNKGTLESRILQRKATPDKSVCAGLNRNEVDCTFQQLAENWSDGVILVKKLLQVRDQAIALYRRESAKTFVDVPRRVVEFRDRT